MFKGGFIQNLPKIYGLYTGGFLVFILLMAILESAGGMDAASNRNSICSLYGVYLCTDWLLI